MRRRDLLDQLVDAVDDGSTLLELGSWHDELTAVCDAAVLAFGAAAVSVARVVDDRLRYEAAAGVGAEMITGTEVGVGEGLGGLVAATGRALIVDDPAGDPRFGRDIAERTGYVPRTLLVVPVNGDEGAVTGVLSVLDRTVGAADALELGSSFAELAARPLAVGPVAQSAGRALLEAVGVARGGSPPDLPAALRQAAQRLDGPDADIVGLLATLGAVRRLDERTRTRVIAMIDEVVALAAGNRAR